MARTLRILVPGGWYHLTSRANGREDLFRTDDDRRRFLGLVAELPERFGLEIHAVIGSGCGGRSLRERRQALGEYTEGPVRQGRLESPWAGLVGGAVLGSEDFAQRVFKRHVLDPGEQTAARRLARAGRCEWPEIVRWAEDLLGKSWPEMARAWGDWGRDGTLYVAVRYGCHRLAEAVRAAGGVQYPAAAQAVRRFAASLPGDPAKQRFVERLKRKLAQSKA